MAETRSEAANRLRISNPGAAVWLATGLGAGYLPGIPGTAGALEGLVIVLLVRVLPFGRYGHSLVLGAMATVLLASGVWSATHAEAHFGKKDPGQVVIDEVVGQMLTFLAWPDVTWPYILAGFALFRILDILKPFPADRLEHLSGGWGIMLDDVVAGIYSLAALSLLHWIFT